MSAILVFIVTHASGVSIACVAKSSAVPSSVILFQTRYAHRLSRAVHNGTAACPINTHSHSEHLEPIAGRSCGIYCCGFLFRCTFAVSFREPRFGKRDGDGLFPIRYLRDAADVLCRHDVLVRAQRGEQHAMVARFAGADALAVVQDHPADTDQCLLAHRLQDHGKRLAAGLLG
jgi:hypothetical protein